MKRIIPIILTLAFFLSLLSSCGLQKEHIITIAESHHGCSIAVEEGRFYGTDENGKLCRIYWHDTAEIAEGKAYAIKIRSRKILFYPGGYTNGWTPRYEATATEVREH